MVLDALAGEFGEKFKKCKRTESERVEVKDGKQKIMLAKAQGFMNNSGRSVSKLISYYKTKPSDLWVIFDDLDLPLGKIRFREKGSAGGHNGVESIIQYLKTNQFNRLKIGLGSNREKNIKAEKYVLQNFSRSEKSKINEAIKKAVFTLKEKI